MSVVVATFNRARLLRRLLVALADQDQVDGGHEIIVVDDGSTDDTAAVVAAWPDVRYMRQENAGPARARNAGWKAARGTFVLFTDDDCVPSPTWAKELAGALAEAPALAGVGGVILPVKDTWITRVVTCERLVDHGASNDDVRYVVTANAGFARRALEEVAGFDERFPTAAGEDVDLSYRVRERVGPLAVTDRAVVLHEHPDSLRAVLWTYAKHGQARAMLDRIHPTESAVAQGSAMVSARYWANRFDMYRQSTSVVSAVAMVVLRVIGLARFRLGMREEHRSRGRVAPLRL